MAVYAVSITKQVPYRGGIQPFSNVYHYKTTLAQFLDDSAIVDDLVAAEKLVHASNVTFLTGRVWGPTDSTPQASVTRLIKDLSGTGSLSPATDTSPEMCILCVWPLGRYGLRNRPQFLRKWIHPCSIAGTTAGQRGQTSKLTNPMEPFTTYINDVTEADSLAGDAVDLCSPTGHEPTGAGRVYDWVEHHQLGDQWR
jgi:hypothetical protein